MKTTKLISKAILAACLCLGMAACGDDDGTNPGGGTGEGGSVGSELKFTGLTVQPNDDVNYTYYRSISYNADGTPRDIGWVRDDRTTIETFYFDYADNAEGGSTITVRYESNVYLDDTRYTCEVNSITFCPVMTNFRSSVTVFSCTRLSGEKLKPPVSFNVTVTGAS